MVAGFVFVVVTDGPHTDNAAAFKHEGIAREWERGDHVVDAGLPVHGSQPPQNEAAFFRTNTNQQKATDPPFGSMVVPPGGMLILLRNCQIRAS